MGSQPLQLNTFRRNTTCSSSKRSVVQKVILNAKIIPTRKAQSFSATKDGCIFHMPAATPHPLRLSHPVARSRQTRPHLVNPYQYASIQMKEAKECQVEKEVLANAGQRTWHQRGKRIPRNSAAAAVEFTALVGAMQSIYRPSVPRPVLCRPRLC